jgi:hypothetical protein
MATLGGATWAEFEAAAPEIAAHGHDLLYRGGDGEAMLVTVRGDAPPRLHPVNAGIVDGHLYTFVQAKSAKRTDLDEDGRYALHTHYDPQAPHEFMVRGRVRRVEEEGTRAAVAANWFFNAKDYPLYELLIDSVLLGHRPTADDWPPVYTSWRAGS